MAKSLRNEKLNKAFRDLRKAGVIARQNFWCCNSCGWYALNSKYPDLDSRTAAFYHAQATEAAMRTKRLYLVWTGDAKLIIGVFAQNGFETEWNGSADTKILVKL